MSASETFRRDQWEGLTDAFRAFFLDLGELSIDAEQAEFKAGFTGLSLSRDGSSRSFMPLHRFGAAWDEVEFDREAREVHIRSASTTYTYRVPPGLNG